MDKYKKFYESIREQLKIITNDRDFYIIPSSSDDIANFEKKIGETLPLSYKNWLLFFGNSKPIGDGLNYTIKKYYEAQKELIDYEYKSLLEKYFPNFFSHYLCIDMISESGVYFFIEKHIENPQIWLYFGDDDFRKDSLNCFTNSIRESLFNIVYYYACRNEKDIISKFPFMKIYSENPNIRDSNFITKRIEFINSSNLEDETGRILTLEEVELMFQEYYFKEQ